MSPIQLSLRAIALAASVALANPIGAAFAQNVKITIGVPPVPEFVLPMIAIDKGYFANHGIDATLTILQGGGAAAGLQSDSIQVAAMGTPSLIQGQDSGLDFVIVSGGAIASVTDTNYGIVTGPNSGIEEPADFVGKKVAVNALGDFFQIMGREWFRLKGVDWHEITFVEGPFPQLADMLKAGTVDAVITTRPFIGGAEELGGKTFHIAADLPDGVPPFIYASTRQWAEANKEAAAGFKAALDEAIAFEQADLAGSLEIFGKYTNFPPEILKVLTINKLDTNVTPAQVQLWVDMMTKQDMLRNNKSPEQLFLE